MYHSARVSGKSDFFIFLIFTCILEPRPHFFTVRVDEKKCQNLITAPNYDRFFIVFRAFHQVLRLFTMVFNDLFHAFTT